MRKLIIAAVAAGALAVPGSSLAAGPGYFYPVAAPNAQCGTAAGSGAFDAFGTYGNVGIHDFGASPFDPAGSTPGANGYQTGLSNSSVCGQRP